MSAAEPPADARRGKLLGTVAAVLALAAIVAASAWLRTPGFTQGGFASHDVAGILYNAMVLEAGGLPYVDTLELKAPGSFFLATWLAGPEGRDIARFQIWANLWGLASLVLVAGLGWRLWGRLGSVAAAALYALHDAKLDSMDANYVTWANLPQIAGFWLGLEASRAGPRWRPALWLLAGAAAGLAALCKRPDGVVLLALLIMAAWPHASAPREQGRAGRLAGPAWVLGGFALAHLPIVALYVGHGELGALVDGYFLSRWGLRYLGAREAGLITELGEGSRALAHFLGLPLILAVFAGAVALASRLRWGWGWVLDDRARREFAFVALWLLGALIAAGLGFRFYKGYFLAVAAPLCLAAAAPWGLLGRACPARWPGRALALLLAVLLVGRELLILDKQREDRARAHDLGGRVIADHLLANTEPGDTIWVWGWHLWDVYPFTGRRSASRIYKSLGILTQPNDDTWRRPASPLRFVESEYSELLLADLERARPAYVVVGSTVPHEDFEALHAFLAEHYQRDHRVRIGRVQFWRLKG